MTGAKDSLVNEITSAYKAGLLRYKHFPYAIQIDFDPSVDTQKIRAVYTYIKSKYGCFLNKLVLNDSGSTIFIYL